jgi:ElaB/YqjD/DUF883 family membrane-anchored ribosome-binding protein
MESAMLGMVAHPIHGTSIPWMIDDGVETIITPQEAKRVAVATTNTLQDNWSSIQKKLLAKWSELSDADLAPSQGDIKELVSTIQRKTGEASETIEKYFKQLVADGDIAFHQIGASVRADAQCAGESIQDASKSAMNAMRHTYSDVESAVKHNPGRSVAIGVATGILTGVALSLLLRRR